MTIICDFLPKGVREILENHINYGAGLVHSEYLISFFFTGEDDAENIKNECNGNSGKGDRCITVFCVPKLTRFSKYRQKLLI